MKTSIAVGGTQAGFGELIWRQFSKSVAEIRHSLARGRAYRALAALDDRTLADIGIERDQIWQVIDQRIGHHAGRPERAHGRDTVKRAQARDAIAA